MKKSVLIALLGLSTAEALKINQNDENEAASAENTQATANNASQNATAAFESGYDLVQAIADLERK
jgi:hypothetical protein